MNTLIVVALLGQFRYSGAVESPAEARYAAAVSDAPFAARVVPAALAGTDGPCAPSCACARPGDCGTDGCRCEGTSARVIKASLIGSRAVADPPAAPRVVPPSRYWVNLTNEPGVRAMARVENGYAVDIERRESIPGYVAPSPPVATPSPIYLAPAPAWSPPILPALGGRLFGRSFGGGTCGPGGCR